MESHSIETETRGEHLTIPKTDDAIKLEQLEKTSTESPIESVEPVTDHVTAKTWLVIIVCISSRTRILRLTEIQILSSTFGLSFWPVPTTGAMQAGLGAKFGDPTSTFWMSMSFF